MTEIYLPATGKPKMYIMDLAFDDIGLSSGEFERTADEYAQALRKLNALMMEFPFSELGYAQPVDGDGQPEELSNLGNKAIPAVAAQLALRLAPAFGKALSREYIKAAGRSFTLLCSEYATIPAQEYQGATHRGNGWSRYLY